MSEFRLALPTARAFKEQHPPKSNFDCWKAAWQQHGKPQMLLGALARHALCCGCATSGVEQLHSLQDWLWPKRRGQLLEGRANCEMKIVVDAAEYDRACTIEIARGIWKMLWQSQAAHAQEEGRWQGQAIEAGQDAGQLEAVLQGQGGPRGGEPELAEFDTLPAKRCCQGWRQMVGCQGQGTCPPVDREERELAPQLDGWDVATIEVQRARRGDCSCTA